MEPVFYRLNHPKKVNWSYITVFCTIYSIWIHLFWKGKIICSYYHSKIIMAFLLIEGKEKNYKGIPELMGNRIWWASLLHNVVLFFFHKLDVGCCKGGAIGKLLMRNWLSILLLFALLSFVKRMKDCLKTYCFKSHAFSVLWFQELKLQTRRSWIDCCL